MNMKRNITDFEGLLVMALLICGVVITLLMTGCSTPMYRSYEVKAFTLVLADSGYIQDLWDRTAPKRKLNVGGFYNPATRTMYVPFDMWKDDYGNLKPNMAILGHEVWHLQELGGRWHD